MNKILYILVLILISASISAQNYARVDSIVKQWKRSYNTHKKLAMQINYEFASDEDKARAIYTWIACNVKYDYKKFKSKKKYINLRYKTLEQKNKKLKKLDEQKINSTYKKRKGICGDYAILFKRLCDYCGLKSKIIEGTSLNESKRIGKKPGRTDHAWNVVKIGNEWKLIDVTWGAGYVNPSTKKFQFQFEDLYFFTSPERFFLKHFPKDTAYLFVDKSKTDFANLPLYSESYIKDSIAVWPDNGVVNFTMGDELTFKVDSQNQINHLAYRFNNSRVKAIPEVEINHDGSFKISSPNKSISYLTIYLNNTAMVTYKLVKER